VQQEIQAIQDLLELMDQLDIQAQLGHQGSMDYVAIRAPQETQVYLHSLLAFIRPIK